MALAPAISSLPASAQVALLGESAAMQAVRRTISQVATTNLPVLLQGESGTGKEVVARLLGEGRAPGSFVKINCAAIPHELWESELFGYEPGAFTGAQRQKSGKFELACGGTMFLDEISEMPPHLQAKLLQVLQDGEFSRLGGHRQLSVDVRVVAASNRDLQEEVGAGRFRGDLYYRLNVVPIFLPPLRERPEDLGLLERHFLAKYAALYQRTPPRFSPRMERLFRQHAWPGNVRELENLIKRWVVLEDEAAITSELEPAEREQPAPLSVAVAGMSGERGEEMEPVSLLDIGRRAAWKAERAVLIRVMEQSRWNRRLAAERLGISYKALQNKLRRVRAEQAAAS